MQPAPLIKASALDIVRPKSTPVDERPQQRRRANSSSTSEPESESEFAGMAIDASSSPPPPPKILQRPTKPLPAKRTMANPNPTMLPVQAHVPKNTLGAGPRRLYVVLEQACLESYRVTAAHAARGGRGGDAVKYALLNCDDHQGILAKMNRDIADARPDITHQARPFFGAQILDFLTALAVPAHAAGLAAEQGGPPAGVHTHHQGRAHRDQPLRPHPAHLQALLRPHGCV